MNIERLNTLQGLIEAEEAKIVLDLSEVTIAERDAATFLAVSELNGIELRNCPAFLRELGWQRTDAHYALAFAEAVSIECLTRHNQAAIDPKPLIATVTTHEERTVISPFGQSDWRMIFTPERVVIETTAGIVVQER